jgi:cobalt-zinc-cadmium efflux system outer membrane protein
MSVNARSKEDWVLMNISYLMKAIFVVAVLAVTNGHTNELDLKALIEEALARNPSLSALKHRWSAFEARIPQAGALNDPMVRFDLLNLPTNSFDFDSSPMSGKLIMLSQQVPFPGTLAAKEAMAKHASSTAEALYEDRESVIVNLVKQAYFTLAFLDRAISITRKNEALLKDLIRIAQTKYAVGRGLQQDVLKAQVSLSSLKDRLIQLRTMRSTTEAGLNLALNRSMQSPVGIPGAVSVTQVEFTLEEIQEMALASRPLLRGLNETVLQWNAAERLARRRIWPSFTFSLGYRQRADVAGDPVNGSDFLSFGVGMNLPLYKGRKQHQQVTEARSKILMAQAQEEEARQQILYKTRVAFLEVQKHLEEATLFNTAILPQAEQSLESAMAGYQVNKVNFLTLLNNQVTLFNFEIDYYRHVTGHESKLAELEAMVGRPLFRAERSW